MEFVNYLRIVFFEAGSDIFFDDLSKG
jgi:hypothetical protein